MHTGTETQTDTERCHILQQLDHFRYRTKEKQGKLFIYSTVFIYKTLFII